MNHMKKKKTKKKKQKKNQWRGPKVTRFVVDRNEINTEMSLINTL
jgi:hypothetical protein